MLNFTKRKNVLMAVFLVGAMLVGCTGGSSTDKKTAFPTVENPITLKASHILQEDHPYQDAFLKMKEIVEDKTGGAVKIDIFANGMLGQETESIEKMISGTIDIATLSPSAMTTLVKEYYACDLPFNFKTMKEAHNFYDGVVGETLFKKSEHIGVVGLAWWEYGMRNVCNGKRPITKPEDMKGIKIRIQNSPVHIATMKALGANPVPLAFSEVYTSLQQGVIDGWETPPIAIILGRYYEVQKYYSLTAHFYDPSPVYVSKKTWDKLSGDQQVIMKEAAEVARDYMRDLISQQTAEAIQKIEENGMKVNEISGSDYMLFKNATKDVAKEFEGDIGKEFMELFNKNLPAN